MASGIIVSSHACSDDQLKTKLHRKSMETNSNPTPKLNAFWTDSGKNSNTEFQWILSHWKSRNWSLKCMKRRSILIWMKSCWVWCFTIYYSMYLLLDSLITMICHIIIIWRLRNKSCHCQPEPAAWASTSLKRWHTNEWQINQWIRPKQILQWEHSQTRHQYQTTSAWLQTKWIAATDMSHDTMGQVQCASGQSGRVWQLCGDRY